MRVFAGWQRAVSPGLQARQPCRSLPVMPLRRPAAGQAGLRRGATRPWHRVPRLRPCQNPPPDLSLKQGGSRFNRARPDTDQMRISKAETQRARG